MNGWITIGTELDTKSFDAQIEDLEDKMRDLEGQKIYFEAHGMVGELKEVEKEIEKTKNKIIDLNKQKAKLELPSKLTLGKSLADAVKQASRLALAIFGIRSAYMMLRQASSELASYDKQYAANLEYIRYVLTQTIAPVLRWIVSMAATLLQIIGSIVSMLFGINIFANASAKSFAKMKAGAGGTAKAAKEIKKQLAGFDEMNILQDNTQSSAGGGGGGGASMPDFDLSKTGLSEEKLAKIKQLLAELLPFILGIVTALTLMKLGLDAITAIGIGIIVAGAVYAIQGLLAYLKDPTWENFGQVLQGLSIAIIGLGIAIGGPAGLTVAIAGAVAFIVSTIIKNWDSIKAFLQGGVDWLLSKVDWVRKNFGIIGEAIYLYIVGLVQGSINAIDILFTTMRGIFDGFIMFLKGVFTGDWKMAWEGIKKIFVSILTGMRDMFITVYNSIMSLVIKVGKKAGDLISGAFKAVVNTVLGAIENILNNPIRAVNGLVDVINGIPGVSVGWHLDELHLPRLAVGGIVNMPGKGKLVGGAIAGERGAEGVIPLTDAQAMETLGQAIGRYITVNANIVNSMNGKVLSRELKRINNEQDFAYNT